MGKHDSLERISVQRLIAEAERLGVGDQVPQLMRDIVAGHRFNGGATAWERLHPDDPTIYGCCWGEINNGGGYCNCWVPEYDLPQQPLTPPGDGEMQPRDDLCGDCAYRPGSPELADKMLADELRTLPANGGIFFCHEGIRRPTRWRHPDGRVVAGDPRDYQPPFDEAGRPYRADGRVAAICAGWAACGRRIQNEYEKSQRTGDARV